MNPTPAAAPWSRNLSLWLGSLAIVGCGGTFIAPDTGARLEISPGDRVQLARSRLSMAIPKGFEKRSDDAWVAERGGQTAILLRFVKHPLPEGDVDAWIDDLINSVKKAGRAGVLRDERITLGDLDARHIGAEDLLGTSRTAIRMVVAPAEDGVYVASFVAEAATLRAHLTVLDAALLTLRIPPAK